MSSSDSERMVSTGLPISELIKLIKHSFCQQRDFNEVQNILIDREKDTKMEIENLRRERDSVKEEVCLLERTVNLSKFEKSKLEEELYKNQRKCAELEETVTRLIEEKIVLEGRERRAEERFDKVSAESSKMANEKYVLIFELKERINELKNKNLENEPEKYKCSDTMVVKMGQEIEDLRCEKLTATKIVEDLRLKQLENDQAVEDLKREIFEANKTIDELRLKKSESDILAALYKGKLENLWSRIEEEDIADMVTMKMGGLANLVNDMRKIATSEEGGNSDFPNFMGKIDSPGVTLSPGVHSTSYYIGLRSSGLSKKGDRNSVQPRSGEDDAHTVKTSPGSQLCRNFLLTESNECNEQLGSGDVIKILETDDETNPNGTADMSNRDVGLNVGRNEMNFVQSPSSSKRSNGNQTHSIEDLLPNSATKRKRKMCTSGEDSISIHEKENEVLKLTHDRVDWSSSRKSREEVGVACDSQTPLKKFNGLNDEVQWAWKREAFQRTKATVKLTSQRLIVGQVAKELKLISDGVYQEFTNTCFGFLMRFDTQGAGSNAVLHYLFAHEVVKPDASPDELWYRVGGRFIRFSKYEYALVTGLSFGATTFDPYAEHDPPASGLLLRHYMGRRLTLDALRRDFTNGVFRQSPTDALKVAKLLIVYFLLFGIDARRYIDQWAWTLIEDTDRWETFIWGKFTYQFLIRFLQQLPTELPRSKTTSYHLYGYAWAFLIWVYEAIPELGTACGVPAFDDTLPRCLRWRFSKAQLDIDRFYDREMEVHSTLEPSEEEQRQPYWEHIHDDLQSGVCYIQWDNKKKAAANPSGLDVPPGFRPQGSRVTRTRHSRSTSAAPLTRERQRADAPKNYPIHLTQG